MKNYFVRTVSLILIAAMLLCSCISEPVSQVSAAVGDIYMTEVCAANKSVLSAADGNYYDWIELYNGSGSDADLYNYALSDNEENLRKWIFPEGVTIAAGQYLIIFCSGLDKVENGEIHTSFKINSKGESVIFTNNTDGAVLDRIEYAPCLDNGSMGIDTETGDSVFYVRATPGAENPPEFYSDVNSLVMSECSIAITECSSDNRGAVTDIDGDNPDWAELYNYGSKSVDLAGMYLSDSDTAIKWEFPQDCTIEAGEYKVVLLSGKDYQYDGGELHCDFGLSDEDDRLVLFSPIKTIVDSIDLTKLARGMSIGKSLDGEQCYYVKPTPGKENQGESYSDISQATRLNLRRIWVSEVLAISCSRDDVSQWKNDWIELYNGSDQPINLNGWGLSDRKAEPYRFKFGSTTVGAGEYIVIDLTGKNSPQDLTADFKLSNSGETIYITDPDGQTVDEFSYGRQVEGVSSGRMGTESDERYYFSTPTKGEQNYGGVTGYTPLPEFSVSDIYVNKGDAVELSARGDYVIRYTTDGSRPDDSSEVYLAPIAINGNTIIRAACFKDSAICGGVSSHTYVVDEPHDIPVVCVCSEPDGLFGFNRGIFADGPGKSEITPFHGANFWKDWERPIHFEYYETDGSAQVDFDAGVRIFGAFSRANNQKSMSIHLREAYGMPSVTYPFFENNEVNHFTDLLLRSGGQDCYMAKLRDGYYVKVIEGQMDMDYMSYKPVAVYMNGKYYGLYNLREKVNENYLYDHGRISTEQVDIIKTYTVLQSGSRQAYKDLIGYARTHDLSKKENYDYICSQIDIQEMINYYMIETFLVNTDSGNIKVYKGYGEEDKWRWVLFDLDMTLFKKSYDWNMIEELLNPNSNFYDTTLLRALFKNDEFKNLFIETYAHHLNTTFAPERTSKILRDTAAVIQSEIPRQAGRWGAPTVDSWNNHINSLESRMAQRVTMSKQHLKSCFNLSNERMRELFPNG